MNELPASKTNISFCMRGVFCYVSSAVWERRQPFAKSLSVGHERSPAEAELLSCAWRQPRSNRNQKSWQIKHSCRIEMSLLMRKVILNCKGPAGQARCEPELKLGALSNVNLLPDPGSKIEQAKFLAS